MMRNLIRLGLPASSRYRISLFLSVAQGLSAIALLASSTWLIARAAEQPSLMYLSLAIVGVRTFALSRAALRYAERWLSHDAVLDSMTAKRTTLFRKIIPLAPSGLRGVTLADLSTRVVADLNELQNLPLRVISPLVQSIAVSLLGVALFGFILPSVVPVLLIGLILSYLLALPISNIVSRRADLVIASNRSRLSEVSMELIEHSELITAFDWVEGRMAKLNSLQQKIASENLIQAAVVGAGVALFSLGGAISSVAAAWLGLEAINSGLSMPVLLAVFALLPLGIFDAASSAQPVISSWRKYLSSARRVSELIETKIPGDIDIHFGTKTINQIRTISMSNVELGYPGQPSALKGLSLTLRAGEVTALVGNSGSGKSTIALAIARLIEPRAGEIALNGVPVSNFSESSFRSKVGYLEQTPTIFDGSLRANLLLASEHATDEDLVSVLNRVGLWRTFSQRHGLDTLLGEKGSQISGGEAQRLAMARAMLRGFDFLILDEPTASVDEKQSLRLLKDLISSVSGEQALLIITHDKKIAKLANKVIALED
jgi:ATP-binding cassette subfamily C protein CydC